MRLLIWKRGLRLSNLSWSFRVGDRYEDGSVTRIVLSMCEVKKVYTIRP